MTELSRKIVVLDDSFHDALRDMEGLRLNGSAESTDNAFQSYDVNYLVIDKPAYIVYFMGLKITFPKKEFELLLLLASNPRKVFKRSEILQHIWGMDFRPKDSRSLDVHIRMLRRKLQGQFITTIRGVGYKLEKTK